MRSAPLEIVGMNPRELADYTAAQIAAVAPGGRPQAAADLLFRHMDQALARLAIPTARVVQWREGAFDVLVSSQHASFLYLLANTVWRETGEVEVPTKLFLLNKSLHGLEVYFRIELPEVFLFVHTVGIVLVNTTYGNYFTIFQNSTVGRLGDDRPIIGDGVIMFPNSAIVGRCAIGHHTVVSQGASLINVDTPGDVRVFPSGRRDPIVKPSDHRLIDRYYRSVDL